MREKFLILINGLGGGGAERVATELANHFVRKLSLKVRIITIENVNIAYRLEPGVEVIYMKTGNLFKGVLGILMIPIIAIEYCYHRYRFKPKYSISFLVRSNLINCFSGMICNKNTIISERSITDRVYQRNTVMGRIMGILVAGFYRHADIVVAISQGVGESLKRIGVSGDKIRVIYNPIVFKKEQSTDAVKEFYSGSRVRMITVGRLVQAKNHRVLIHTVAELVEQNIDVELEILGEGGMEVELKELSLSLGVEDRVLFRGFVNDIEEELAKADIFVLSSNYEGFGNVILEAMRAGLPVVSTDCQGGPREILDPLSVNDQPEGGNESKLSDGEIELGEYGVLCAINSKASLFKAIKELYNHPLLAKKYSSRGRKRVKDFDINIIAGKYIELAEIQG